MLDLHVHALPWVDDGPPDMQGSVDLVRAAARDGVRAIVATPHLRRDFPRVRPERLALGCEALRVAVRRAGLGVQILPGSEIDLSWAAEASAEELRLASLGQRGRDLLLETPYGPLHDGFEMQVFELAVRGFRVTLAHPERNATLRDDPDRMAGLVERGVLVQLSSGSLTGDGVPRAVGRFAHELLDRELAHVIASDAHAASGGRPPGLSDAVRAAGRSEARARWMTTAAPAAVVAGKPLPPAPELAARRRGRRRPSGARRGPGSRP